MTTEVSEPLFDVRAAARPFPCTPAPRLAPDRLRNAVVGGAGAVALLWGLQAEASARLDAVFATGAHLTGLLTVGALAATFLTAAVEPAAPPAPDRAPTGTTSDVAQDSRD